MFKQKPGEPPVPRWAWIFAGACLIIPVVTLGGAIPAGIGGVAVFGVLAFARQSGWSKDKKILYCSVVTGSAWAVFIVFLVSLAALQTKYPILNASNRTPIKSGKPAVVRSEFLNAPQPADGELNEEDRRDVYRMAMRTRNHIEFAQANGSSARHIERLEEMHEKRLDFTTRFHDITREQLDDILAEGTTNNWPID